MLAQVARLSHGDLRNFEWTTDVGQVEWCGSSLVVLGGGDDPDDQVIDRGELSSPQVPRSRMEKGNST